MSDKGKLAETLAESIAEKLGDSDMFLDKRFDSIMASLNSIQWGDMMSLKRIYDSQELYNNRVLELITAATKVIDSKTDKSTVNRNTDTNKKSETSENEESEDILGVETTDDKTPIRTKINKLETNQYRILGGIDNIKKDNKKNTESAIKKSEERIQTRTIRMERSIKRTIKSRLGKLWSMFKKVLVVGLLLFFAPAIKNAFAKIGDKLAYVFEPMVNWFTKNFPVLTGYIKDLTAYIGNLASDFSWIVDKLKGALDWKDEHNTELKVGAGAASGLGLGMAVGSVIPGVGTVVGGAVGLGIGATAGAVSSYLDKEKELDRLDAIDAAEAAKPIEQKQAEKADQFVDKYYKNATEEDKAIVRAWVIDKDKWYNNLPSGMERLATDTSNKYYFGDESWLEYSKAHGNTKELPTWDQWSNYVQSKNPVPEGGEDFNPDSQGGEGGATPKEPLSATSFQQHQYININNNNIVVTEQPLYC